MNKWTVNVAKMFYEDRDILEENSEQQLGKNKSIDRITKRLARNIFSKDEGDMNRVKFLQLCGTYDANQKPIQRTDRISNGKHPFAGKTMIFHPECVTVNEEEEKTND